MSDSPNSPLPAEALPAAAKAHDPYAALRVGGFRWYLCGWVLVGHRPAVAIVAVGWEIFQRTHSTPAGSAGSGWPRPARCWCWLFPPDIWPMGQSKTDRGDTQLASAACSAGLALVVWRHGSIFSHLRSAHGRRNRLALGGPARSALLPHIVSADKFANAVSWYSSLFQVAAVTGPAIGGIIIRHATWPAFIVDAACAAWFALVATTLLDEVRARRAPAAVPRLSVRGVRFVWRTKIILATITLDLFAVLLGGATLSAAGGGHGHSARRLSGIRLLRAAPAIGAFTMAMLVAHRPPMKQPAAPCSGPSPDLARRPSSLACRAITGSPWRCSSWTGAFDNISVLVRHTLVQVLTPDEMRGRVSAVNNVFIGASNELGGLESGVTAAIFGTVTSIVGGGIGTIVVVHVQNQIHDAVAVAPFVVVPAHQLEEALFALEIVLQRGQAVVDRRARIVDEVGGDQFLLGDAENALEIVVRLS
jgi:hypothetical protein